MPSIAEISNERFPAEACGFVLGTGEIIECENYAEDPIQNFHIRPEEAAWWWRNAEVVAVWHSHCFDVAVPSEADEAQAPSDIEFWIYSVPEEDLGVYRLDDDGRLQLVRMESAE